MELWVGASQGHDVKRVSAFSGGFGVLWAWAFLECSWFFVWNTVAKVDHLYLSEVDLTEVEIGRCRVRFGRTLLETKRLFGFNPL